MIEKKRCAWCDGSGKCRNYKWLMSRCVNIGCGYRDYGGVCKLAGRCPACGGSGWV